MSLLPPLDYARPESLEEAIGLLGEAAGSRPLAGGQSLLNDLKHRVVDASLLVDVSGLQELRRLEAHPDGSLELGAALSYDELAQAPELRAAHVALSEVAGRVGDQQVRCRGTLGGNACQSDPGSDFAPLLVALQAKMCLTSTKGERQLAAADFFVGPREVALTSGELLRSVLLPPLAADDRVGYASIPRRSGGLAIARAATALRENGTVESAIVVLGCVAPRPVRAASTEKRLLGAPATEEAASAAAELAAEDLNLAPDRHVNADYRRAMACVAARRALSEAIGGRG